MVQIPNDELPFYPDPRHRQLKRYELLGTIQTQVHGQLHECSSIWRQDAYDPADAERRVLEGRVALVRATDPHATVRWYNPPHVRHLRG